MKPVLLALLILFLTGCANWQSIYRTTHTYNTQTAFVDAKQRAIHYKTDQQGKVLRICAEKSPDVFSVIASAFSGTDDKNQLALALSRSESGANIGLRTQLTQAQSEFLYRLCEANMNGDMSTDEMQRQLRKFPNHIVAMLAIEQLTGYAQPTTVTLQTNGSTSSGELLAQAQKDLEKARSQETAKKVELETAQKAATDAQEAQSTKQATLDAEEAKQPKDEAKIATLKSEVETLGGATTEKQKAVETTKKAAAEATENREAQERIRDASRSVNVATGALPSVIKVPGNQPDANSIQHVARAVEKIVKTTLRQTNTTEDCLVLMHKVTTSPNKESAPNNFVTFCTNHLNAVRTAQTDYQQNRLTVIASAIEKLDGKLSQDQFSQLIETVKDTDTIGPYFMDQAEK